MKKLQIVLVALFIVCCASASFAKEGDKSIEGGLALGNKTSKNDGVQSGVHGGVGYEILDNMQVRGDFSYLTRKPDGGESTYRMPIDISLRYLHPFKDKVTLIGQGGLEFSMDKDINQIGLILGGGAEFEVKPNIGIISTVNFHFVPGGYASWNVGVAYHY